jgi:hypothetical protein
VYGYISETSLLLVVVLVVVLVGVDFTQSAFTFTLPLAVVFNELQLQEYHSTYFFSLGSQVFQAINK